MEYQFEQPIKNNMPTAPKRFSNVDDNKHLKYKFAKETRSKARGRDRWAKLNRDEVCNEHLTKSEIWDIYIDELKHR